MTFFSILRALIVGHGLLPRDVCVMKSSTMFRLARELFFQPDGWVQDEDDQGFNSPTDAQSTTETLGRRCTTTRPSRQTCVDSCLAWLGTSSGHLKRSSHMRTDADTHVGGRAGCCFKLFLIRWVACCRAVVDPSRKHSLAVVHIGHEAEHSTRGFMITAQPEISCLIDGVGRQQLM